MRKNNPVFRILHLAGKFNKVIGQDGFTYAWYLVQNKVKRKLATRKIYKRWIEEKEADRMHVDSLSYKPLLSVVVPVYNVSEKHLTECMESVIGQTYDNWELCLADDASTLDCVKKVLKKYEENPKIKIVYREKNGHISAATNSAMELATGEFIAFMDCDDVLAPNALYEMAKKLNEDMDYDYIYSDEDKINHDGTNRHMPHFKSDWAPDTLMSYMYTSHFSMYRKSMVDELGGLRIGYEGAQDYDLTLRFMEKTDKIGHIPKILYHWRETKTSTSSSITTKPYILEAARKAKEDALKRRGLQGKIELIENLSQFRVNYVPTGNPLVSVIIPSKDNVQVYRRCIETLFEKTLYKNYEVIHVDNGSSMENKAEYEKIAEKYGIQYHYEKMDFNFSAMCNIGVRKSKGEYLLFLNDDIEIINGDWLERMLGHAMLEHVGAVGAKLLYPETGNIQHTGVVNVLSGPVHCLGNKQDDVVYSFCRNRLDFNYSAVTGACLLVSKRKFDLVEGFDEELPVAYNDVDFCFKLTEQGFYNVLRNDAILYHHESVSRGYDGFRLEKMQRLANERNKLYERHPQYYQKDPFYSTNLSQVLADFNVNTEFEKKKLKIKVIKNKGTGLKEERTCMDVQKNNWDVSKNNMICFHINVVQIEDKIQLEGFAFIKNKRFNNLRKVDVIFAGDIESYCFETEKTYCGRFQKDIPHKGKIGMTGFSVSVNSTLLKNDNYHVYLKIGNKVYDTGKAISCKQ